MSNEKRDGTRKNKSEGHEWTVHLAEVCTRSLLRTNVEVLDWCRHGLEGVPIYRSFSFKSMKGSVQVYALGERRDYCDATKSVAGQAAVA